jgi:hypothetical protein
LSELTESGLKVHAELRGHERANQMRDPIEREGFGAAIMALSMDFVVSEQALQYLPASFNGVPEYGRAAVDLLIGTEDRAV